MAEPIVDISLVGDEQVAAALGKLPGKVQKKLVRKAMRPPGKVILQKVKAATPVRHGVLRKSLKLRALKRSRFRMGMMIPLPTRDALGISATARSYYPTALEYGWKDRYGHQHPARSYIRGPVNANQAWYVRQVGRGTGKLVDEEMKAMLSGDPKK